MVICGHNCAHGARSCENVIKLVTDDRDGTISLEDAINSSTPNDLEVILADWRTAMQPYGTARLWMQYQRMIAILSAFVRSVRIGSWPLYLQSLYDMRPYIAAAGHNNYTKSLALFIQKCST